jgi:hypothetical protein
MYGFWGKSIHGNKGVNSAGLALIAGQFFYRDLDFTMHPKSVGREFMVTSETEMIP